MSKTIMILDTETIGLEKAFTYDIGYIIAQEQNDGTYKPIDKKQFIIDQVYNNKMLFETAYYHNKRPKYISLLKGRKARLKKMGHALMIMRNDIERYNVSQVWAYNMPFDSKVLAFNSEKFNLINPIEHLPQLDIMGITTDFIHDTQEYKTFAVNNGYVSEANNILVNAENTFQFISGVHDFVEEHTSLQDCEIELDILNYCILKGADLEKTYKRKYIKADTTQELKIIVKDQNKNSKEYIFNYRKKTNSKVLGAIVLEK